MGIMVPAPYLAFSDTTLVGVLGHLTVASEGWKSTFPTQSANIGGSGATGFSVAFGAVEQLSRNSFLSC